MRVARHVIHRPWTGITASAAFSPADIAGLVAWYDASDAGSITESGGLVSQLDDLSGNGYHLTQGTGANQPSTGTRTMGTEALNAIEFASGKYLSRTVSSIGGNAHTWYAAVQMDTIGNGNYARTFTLTASGVLDYNNPSSISAILRNDASAGYGSFYNNTPRAFAAAADGADHCVVTQRDGDGSSVWINGGSATTASGLGTTALAVVTIVMGGETAGTANLDGMIGELIWYSSALGTTDRETVRDHLNAKWGLY
jgi:hypothetical protein